MNPHAIFELRRYRLLPGRREALIRLFDSEFIEPQETLGMRVEGEFRDLDDPDCFVWVRSFEDMDARTEALASFYDGPAWKRAWAGGERDDAQFRQCPVAQAGGGCSAFRAQSAEG